MISRLVELVETWADGIPACAKMAGALVIPDSIRDLHNATVEQSLQLRCLRSPGWREDRPGSSLSRRRPVAHLVAVRQVVEFV